MFGLRTGKAVVVSIFEFICKPPFCTHSAPIGQGSVWLSYTSVAAERWICLLLPWITRLCELGIGINSTVPCGAVSLSLSSQAPQEQEQAAWGRRLRSICSSPARAGAAKEVAQGHAQLHFDIATAAGATASLGNLCPALGHSHRETKIFPFVAAAPSRHWAPLRRAIPIPPCAGVHGEGPQSLLEAEKPQGFSHKVHQTPSVCLLPHVQGWEWKTWIKQYKCISPSVLHWSETETSASFLNLGLATS